MKTPVKAFYLIVLDNKVLGYPTAIFDCYVGSGSYFWWTAQQVKPPIITPKVIISPITLYWVGITLQIVRAISSPAATQATETVPKITTSQISSHIFFMVSFLSKYSFGLGLLLLVTSYIIIYLHNQIKFINI